MSDLNLNEKTKLERLFGMSGGYVLDFSNRTFEEFVVESTGRRIFDEKYNFGSGSKANRLRGFWSEEGNHVVAKLLGDLIDRAMNIDLTNQALVDEARKIVDRLKQAPLVAELDSLTKVAEEGDFEIILKAVRESLEEGEPEAALDRLHTFVTKYVRTLCERRGIITDRNKPLHGAFGEYVKSLKASGDVESEMAERILKTSISLLEAFNHVRNNQSLAHDNELLGYHEALLILNYVTSTIHFLREVERRGEKKRQKGVPGSEDHDLPF